MTAQTEVPQPAATIKSIDRGIVTNFVASLGFNPDTVVHVALSPHRAVVTTYKLDEQGRPNIIRDESGDLITETELHVRYLDHSQD